MLIQVDSDELVAKPTAATFFHHPKPFGFSKGFHLNERKSTSGVSHHHTRCIASHPVFQGESQQNNESTTAWSSATTRNHIQHYGNSPFLKENQPKNGSRKKPTGPKTENGAEKKLQGLDVSQQQTFGIQKQQSSEGTSLVPWIGYEEKEGKFLKGRKIKKWWVGDRFKFEALKQKLAHETSNWNYVVTLWTQSSISVRKKTLWFGCVLAVPIFSKFLNQKLEAVWDTVRWMNRQKWPQVTPRFASLTKFDPRISGWTPAIDVFLMITAPKTNVGPKNDGF